MDTIGNRPPFTIPLLNLFVAGTRGGTFMSTDQGRLEAMLRDL